MKMKKKGYAMGGMKKGYSKGGMKKKGFAAGGMSMGAPKMTPEMMAKAKKDAALKKKMGGRNMSAKPAMPMGSPPAKPMGGMPSPQQSPMGGGAPKMPMMKKGGMTKKGFKAGGPTQKGTKARRLKQSEADQAAINKKFSGRGTSGAAEAKKQRNKIVEKSVSDQDSIQRYGKDAPKGRSFGQKTQPRQGKMTPPQDYDEAVFDKFSADVNADIKEQLQNKKKGGSIKKMKKGGMAKKGFKAGGVAKKGKAKGGKMGGKSKVRGAGIAQRGVRPAKMR